MASNPVSVTCNEGAWTLFAENAQGGMIHNQNSAAQYLWTYRIPGHTAPTLESEGVLIAFKDGAWKLPDSFKADYYIYCRNADGKIRYDELPLTGDVFVQDQTTPWADLFFLQAIGTPTTLTAAAVIDAYTITVTSIANISIGDYIGIFSGTAGDERYMFATVLNIATLTLTLDTPIDYNFGSGSPVLAFLRNLNVDGSVTPQVFEIQAGNPAGSLSIDITRIMMKCFTDDTVSLDKFGDVEGGLTRGLVMRVKENGTFRNKWNVKNNGELGHLAYDWTPYAATNPNAGQNGFLWRFSLNGPDKHGVPQRVIGNTNTLQLIVGDDLTGIVSLQVLGANQEVD